MDTALKIYQLVELLFNIIPGGVPMTDDRSGTFVDPIQTDKDRIFAGQQFPRFADEFHYRIDD